MRVSSKPLAPPDGPSGGMGGVSFLETDMVEELSADADEWREIGADDVALDGTADSCASASSMSMF